jgi:hypothetical protein
MVMDYLRKVCKSEADFKNMWKHECTKEEEKLQVINDGLWKSRFDHVHCCDNHEFPRQIIQRGRFLITLSPSPPVVVRKGRFLVTKVFMFNKPQPKKTQPKKKKPTVTRKGRFVITSY